MNFKSILLSVVILLISFSVGFSQTFPEKPGKLVNDYTNTLSADEIKLLEKKLVAFDDSTSTQIAVVLIPSLEGYEIADYAIGLFEKWGIGGSKNNNGILLLVSLGDRKVTIRTGYGVEGVLPDAIAKRIIENEIKPGFKLGNYYAGINAGTNAIIAYTKGEYKNESSEEGLNGFTVIGFVFLFIMIIFIIIGRKGGGGSQIINSRGATSAFWLFGASQLGNDHDFGGFSGGGGFGGFGGGSTGGGGASGSW
ncbi:MAG: TPM domain-containing protein [Daejeonella sp.]